MNFNFTTSIDNNECNINKRVKYSDKAIITNDSTNNDKSENNKLKPILEPLINSLFEEKSAKTDYSIENKNDYPNELLSKDLWNDSVKKSTDNLINNAENPVEFFGALTSGFIVDVIGNELIDSINRNCSPRLINEK